ncbi:nuclear transport factor 2 family protein [Paraburkholderia hayleyella]|uniref:nuclear transport factor 2 family protein n=1 Tax=Paraburkholderia hayleyella TaxID=2152889 RepID=UPI00129246EE|nr:nuclear transport factor 2 family protein [Paraburkholderia hayleyella]
MSSPQTAPPTPPVQPTQTAQPGTNVETLIEFSAAFNRHDAKALMHLMTPDCVFEAAGGKETYGARFVGQAAVREAFDAVFRNFPDAHWGDSCHYTMGERGVSEWLFTGTHRDGRRIEAQGCDLFVFRDGLIAVKRAFRKDRPPQNV